MLPFAPGTTGIKLLATFLPAGATTPTTFTATWSSSDANVTVTTDSTDTTGMTADVNVQGTAVVGATGTITAHVTGTNADGSPLDVTGTFNFTIVAAANNPTGVQIEQVA